jgi:Glycosyltransferase sugar-binding region containing DXD motif
MRSIDYLVDMPDVNQDGRIPRRLHFLWDGQGFQPPYAAAVTSARRHHPDWEIILHSGDAPRNNAWWDSLASISRTEILTPEIAAQDLPIAAADFLELYRRVNYPAGRSNLLRLSVLWKSGGVYLDLDTACVAPLDDLLDQGAFVGEEVVWKHDNERVERGFLPRMVATFSAFVISWLAARAGLWRSSSLPEALLRKVWGSRELNNAVIGARAGHPWVRLLLEMALEADPTVRFALGPALFNRAWARGVEQGVEMPERHAPEVFYQFPPSQTVRFFGACCREELPLGARVLHWCSSNHRKDLPLLTPEWANRHSKCSLWARESRSQP